MTQKAKPTNAFLLQTDKIRNNKKWGVLFLFLSIIILAALPEAIARHNLDHYINFFTSWYALVYLLTVFSILGLFFTISNNYGLAWILTFVPISLLAQINHLKSANNSKPLFPWDILIVWEGLKAANSMADPRKVILLTLGIVLAGLITAAVLLLILPKFPFRHQRKRIAAFAISLIVLVSILTGQHFNLWFSSADNNFAQATNFQAEYNKKGFLVAFLNNITGLPKIYVEDYSKETVGKIISKLPKAENIANDFQPDIVVLVSESFFDITKIPNIKYSEPVNPFFQQLRKKNSINWFSPTFGGQTANAEFEMLTGFPLILFSPQVVPYRLYLRRQTESIASVLKANGYKSIMIHPYVRNFWSRNTVIPNMGFDEFIALENMKYTEKRGGFTSDDSLISEAIDILEEKEQPVFLYLMTVQNHYPFKAGRYDKYDNAVKVSSDKLNEEENGLLESYANGVLDSDRTLKRIVEYLKTKSQRPALVLFHGDHLPTLNGSKIYEKLGYKLDDDNLSRYRVDGVVWSSYPLKLKNNADYQMCYLPMKLLQWARQPMGGYFKFLEGLSENYSILHSKGIYDLGHNRIPSADFFSSEAGYNLRHLVYDLMFGRQYLTEKVESH